MAFILPFNGILPKIAPNAFVADNAVIIGDVEIGAHSNIWFGCVLRGDVNVIRIGARTNIQDGTVVHVSTGGQGTHVGDGVTVGHMALLHDCTVESDAFVGMKACVLDKACIESGAMLAAGGLLTGGKRIPRGELWAGNPAKLLRALTDKDQEMIKKSAVRYCDLGREYAL
jgi:gamma-carbonic anhydrase